MAAKAGGAWGLAILWLVLWTAPAPAAETLPLTGHHRLASGLVPVPGLAGLAEAQARAALQEVGLRGRVRLARRDCAGQAGAVVGQSPAAGQELAPGAWVDLIVCPPPSPARRVEVPDLRGMDESQAKALLKSAGLHLAVKKRPSCGQAGVAGSVLCQRPAPGQQLGRGRTVWVQVCRGRQETPPSAARPRGAAPPL